MEELTCFSTCLYQILSKFTGFLLPLLFSVLPSTLSCDSSVISEETGNLYIMHDTTENRSCHVEQINNMLLKSLIPKWNLGVVCSIRYPLP